MSNDLEKCMGIVSFICGLVLLGYTFGAPIQTIGGLLGGSAIGLFLVFLGFAGASDREDSE